jgi:hypothetical protein
MDTETAIFETDKANSRHWRSILNNSLIIQHKGIVTLFEADKARITH